MEEQEKVIGVIPNTKLKVGFIRWESYTLVATTKRLIAANIRSNLVKEEARKRAEKAKSEGHGRFKQYLARAGTNFTFANRYLEMTPEAILKETPKNFTIYPEEVKAIRVSEGYQDEDGNKSPNSLVIRTTSRKYAFSFNSSTRTAKNLLAKIGH